MNTSKNILRTFSFAIAFVMFSMVSNAQKIEDNEIKKNVTTIDNPLEKIIQLEPKIFEYNKTKYKDLQLPSGKQYGFMSENLQTVFPDLVTYKSYNYSVGKNSFRTAKVKEVDTESIIPILVASIKEQQAEIKKLKEQVLELQSKSASVSTQ